MEGLRKTTRNLNEDSWNVVPSEYCCLLPKEERENEINNKGERKKQ
jgi:hypothetical protein